MSISLDVDEHRLSFAKTIGADCTLKIGKESDLEIVKKIHDALGCEPTVTIDCCGAEQAVRVSLQVSSATFMPFLKFSRNRQQNLAAWS